MDADNPAWAATKCRVTEYWTHNLDRTANIHTDFRGEDWTTQWSGCCANRQVASIDPLSTTGTTAYDHGGRVTYQQTLHGTTVFNESTTRFDARGRQVARTTWLVGQQNIDSQDPPIAGGGETGDPDAHDGQGDTVGLTTRWFYDEDLTDGVGLDGGITVAKLDAAGGSFTLDISDLLDELYADIGSGATIFAAGCTGSATAIVNPEDEISVSIQDGQGRTVCSGVIKQDGTPITWNCAQHDGVENVAGFGDCLVSKSISALDHSSRRLSDAAGRKLQSIDALGKITTYEYDASGNTLEMPRPQRHRRRHGL